MTAATGHNITVNTNGIFFSDFIGGNFSNSNSIFSTNNVTVVGAAGNGASPTPAA